jgi:flagellar biosynthesis/type III secretory pathway chaperone
MPTAPDIDHSLFTILQHGIREAETLLELLDEEQRLLRGTDPGALERLTQRKQQQIENLEVVVVRQDAFLQQQGLPPGPSGMQGYLDGAAVDDAIKRSWTEFVDKLARCRKQNTLNGALLVQSQRQISHALQLLLGAGEANRTYGPSGEARSNQTANSLGKA